MMRSFVFVSLVSLLAHAPALAEVESSSMSSIGGEITESSADMIRLKAVDRRSLSQALLFPAKDRTIISLTPAVTHRTENYQGMITGRRTELEYRETRYEMKAMHSLGRSDWALELATSLGRASSTIKRTGRPTSEFNFGGFGDVELTARTVAPVGRSNAQYGLTASISPGDQEFAVTDRDGNFYSGGHSLKPFASFETPMRYGNAGASLAYVIYGERTKVEKDAGGGIADTEKDNGANRLQARAFTEYQKLWFSVGAMAGLDYAETGTTTLKDGTNFSNDAATWAQAILYGNFKVAPSFDLAPKISYETLVNKQLNNVSFDKNDVLTTSLSALVNF